MPWKKAEQIEPAALLLGERDVRLGQRGRLDLALHQRCEPVARAVRRAAQLDLLARQEAFQHMQREIMRAEIERHADACGWRAAAACRPANPARTTMAA